MFVGKRHAGLESAAKYDEWSDEKLLAAVRSGDNGAYGTLWQRHEPAARSLARSLCRQADVDELVSESFTRVLAILQRGGGPESAFTAYLSRSVRHVHLDLARRYYGRLEFSDNPELNVSETKRATSPSAADTWDQYQDRSAAWRAWQSLDRSDRGLLWKLVIEEAHSGELAAQAGISANAMSARGSRARERLRQAFLQQHVRAADDRTCATVRNRLGRYSRNHLSRSDAAVVRDHLRSCDRCTAAAVEVRDLNKTLRAAIAPIVAAGAALTNLGGGNGVAVAMAVAATVIGLTVRRTAR